MSFTPSPEQARRSPAIKDWFRHRRDEQQVFRVFGYAGSGKSTLTAHAIAELGLDADGPRPAARGGVLYGAFTGKAALVMTRKGTPASTIHSLIYRVLGGDAGGDRARRAGSARSAAPASAPWGRRARLRRDADPPPRAAAARPCTSRASCSTSSRCCATPSSSCSTRSRWSAPEMARRPAGLRQADPGARRSRPAAADQGRRRLHRATPDVMLTEIHRQAGGERDHPARHHGAAGRADPLRRARRLRLEDARAATSTPEQLLSGGQVICGRNATRLHAQRRHEARRRVRRRLSRRAAARRSSASRTGTTSGWSTACSSSSPTSRT